MGAIKRGLSFLFAVLLLTTLVTPNFAQADSGEWERVSPNPTASTIEGVAYGNGQFVAVGYNMGILTFKDGDKWKLSSVPINNMFRLLGVSYGNGRFVVVGSSGLILTLEDGQTEWKLQQQNVTSYGLTSVSFGNGRFVAVGAEGKVLTSIDGITWTGQTVGATNNFHKSITFGKNKFVGVGNRGFVIESSDGTTWNTKTVSNTAMFNGITYGNDKYVAVGQSGLIMTSTDGANWTNATSNTTTSLSKVTYDAVNNLYVAVGGGGVIVTSTNGTNWGVQATGTTKDLNDISAENGRIVAVGYNGAIFTSTDGITWSNQLKGTAAGLEDIVYGNGMFVAVGYDLIGSTSIQGAIITSEDGEAWVNRKPPLIPYKRDHLSSISYGNSKFIALGNRDITGIDTKGLIMTSSNGISWTEQLIEDMPMGSVYGNQQYVIVTNSGNILTSPDGESWTTQTSGVSETLYSVTYGNGLYVAVGGNNILNSSDGITWNVLMSDNSIELYKVAYGNGLFVAVGAGGKIVTSEDGTSWTNRSSNVYQRLVNVQTDGSGFKIAGDDGVILTSNDGIVWSKEQSGETTRLKGLASNGSILLAVGEEGLVLKKTITSSTINPAVASFDKNSNSVDYKNVATTIDLKGNELTGISNGSHSLVQDNDYTFDNGIITISKDYLSKQAVGTTELSFTFSKGAPVKFVITISDTRSPSVTVSYLPGDYGTLNGTSEQVEVGGHPVAVPTVTPMNGYHFAGWSSDGGVTKLTSHQITTSTVTADVTYTAYYTQFVMGDADGDGKVTASDALLLTKYIKGKITLTPQQLQSLDMNGDGILDNEDVKIILAISVGKG